MKAEDDERREFAAALQAAVLRLRRLGVKGLGIEPIPLSEVEVLRHVADHPGRSVTDVAEALALQPSNVSVTVRALVGRGLVVREPDPLDGRRHLLHVTPEARADRQRIAESWFETLTAFLDELPADQRRAALAATPALRALGELRVDHGG